MPNKVKVSLEPIFWCKSDRCYGGAQRNNGKEDRSFSIVPSCAACISLL